MYKRQAEKDGCQNYTIQNCTLTADSAQDCRLIYSHRNMSVIDFAGTNSNIKILNNSISKGRFGIMLNDGGGLTPYPDENNEIAGNTIFKIGINNNNSGINAADQKNFLIHDNEVKDFKTGPNYADWIRGISIGNCIGPVSIYNNKVHGLSLIHI